MRANILIAHSDQVQAETFSLGLSVYGHSCICVDSKKDIYNYLNIGTKQTFNLLIADISNPGWVDAELILKIHRKNPDLPVVVISGLKKPEALEKISRIGVPIISKPFNPKTLNRVVHENARVTAER